MNYSLILDTINNWIEINFLLSIILFSLFVLLYSFFSLPGLLIFVVFSGYAFGIISFFLVIFSEALGCLFFFFCAQKFFKKFFIDKYNYYNNKINKYIKTSTLEYLIIFRLLPTTPLMIQNLILSLLNISPSKFIIATLVGFTPINLFAIFVGNKLNNISNVKDYNINNLFSWDFFLIIFLLISIILIKIFFKKIKFK